MMNTRLQQLNRWLKSKYADQSFELNPLPHNEASFRKFYRLIFNNPTHHATMIVIDAPPHLEDNAGFIKYAIAYKKNNLRVPEIFAFDLEQGFILESDLGDALLFNLLNENNVDSLYQLAMQNLLSLQQTDVHLATPIPAFNEQFIQREFSLFEEWFISKYLELSLTKSQQQLLAMTFNQIQQIMDEQPSVFMHRDFHSRNLLLSPNSQLGIVDLQDSMLGPITYDLVSLLKDCYIAWPEEKVAVWVNYFYELLRQNQRLNKQISLEKFNFWFDISGLQRHLKVLGIFTRLHLRDNKSHYLQHLDRIMNYVVKVAAKYPELNDFYSFFVTTLCGRAFQVPT